MIELFPNVPVPNPTPGATVRNSGQADFGQWLAPSTELATPAETLPAVTPVVPTEEVPVLGPVASIIVEQTDVASVSDPVPVPEMAAPSLPVDAAMVLPGAIPSTGDDGLHLSWALVAGEPGEAVQLVASPWRLAPGDRLSQQLHATLSVAVVGDVATVSVSIAAPPAIAGGVAASAVISGEPRGAVRQSAEPGLPLPAWAVLNAAANSASEESAAGRSAAQAQAAHWPLRLLRWLNDSEGGSTLWLRDFTSEPGAAPALVDDLRRFAQAEGLPLRRIVLNGRTLWAADLSLRDST